MTVVQHVTPVSNPDLWRGDDREALALIEMALPEHLLERLTPGDVPLLPSFLIAMQAVERQTGQAFERLPLAFQNAVIERRLRQLVEVCRANPLWQARIDGAIGSGPLASLDAFQAIPVTGKETARQFYTGDRPGMVVPITHGGFQVATSGGTASGELTEIVYPLDELADTYRWAGEFIGRHIIAPYMPDTGAKWIVCTLADHMMWSSSSMVGGVLQNIPGINYIGAGAIDHKVFQRILAYPGAKAIMGIGRSVADLVAFAKHSSAEERASLRIALYGSGALQPKVHADLHAAYPNLVVLSFFAAMQAETIGLQLDPASPVLTAIPGLHLVEIVDDDNRAVAVGEEGDLLVTRLFGNGAPVLRYRLGDRMLRRPDLVSNRLNAMRFEYVGRSSDRFEIAGSHLYAPKVVSSIVTALRAAQLIDLDGVADNIQLQLDRRHRRLTIVATTQSSRQINAPDVQNAILTGMALAGLAEAGRRDSGYRFDLMLVRPDSQELVTTGVGKTPLLVDLG